MNTPWITPIGLAALAAVLAGCASLSKGARDRSPDPLILVGALERATIEVALPPWVEAQVEASVDPMAVRRLTSVDEGAEVSVYLGTWCGDSRRELGRFWRALDDAGVLAPFAIEYIGVDHEKEEPAGRTRGRDIQYVPTFIVSRHGEEVGRIIESAPGGVESDLADLLSGSRTGIISGRSEFAGPAETEDPDGQDPDAGLDEDREEATDEDPEGRAGTR